MSLGTVLRGLLAAALALVVLMLAVANKELVTFVLPQGDLVRLPLWLLLVTAFVAGWLPTWLYHVAVRTQLKRRLARVEATQLPPVVPPPVSPAVAPTVGL